MACTEMEDIIQKFNSFTQKPVKFLSVQDDVKDDIKNLVKSLYDFTKSEERTSKREKKSALSELIVQDFDEEQIWQQIELQNSERWDQFVWEVANCISKNELKFPLESAEEHQEPDTEDIDYEDDNSESLDEDENKEHSAKSKKVHELKPKSKSKPSVVDDKFFKLNEMEQFLLQEEKHDGNKKAPDSDEESIDMFEDIDDELSSNEEGRTDMMYYDFFDGQNDQEANDDEMSVADEDNEVKTKLMDKSEKINKKKVTFADAKSDDEHDSEDTNDGDDDIEDNILNIANGNTKDEKKSDFELRQQRLQEKISKLEEKTLTEAAWQLKGEIDATKRPQNSLLEEVLDFDLTTRPPPIITEQTTITLEEIIKQRIKDKAWDDVVKKDKPVNDQLTFRKTEVLDHSKSKQSLAQVYEAEYLKQKQALSGDTEEEKEPEAHTQIKNAMSKLFNKLDALCHYHYTPKAPQAEVKIVTNTPAISMEEVAPVATSDAALLAPEEVKKKRRGDLMGKEERTQTDKNRERRKKKKLQRKKGNVAKVTDHRNTKKGVESNDKSLKTSKAFFQQLNDDSTSLIKSSKAKHNVKNKGQ